MITEAISSMVGSFIDALDGAINLIASQPLLLAGIAIFLIVNGINMMRTIMYDGYSPEEYAQHQEEYAQHQEEYEQLKQEAIKEYEQPKQEAIKVKPKRKLNYSVCPVCNAPVDNSRDDCKYCGSLYV